MRRLVSLMALALGGCAVGTDASGSGSASFGPGGDQGDASVSGSAGSVGDGATAGDGGANCVDLDGDGFGEECNAGPDCNDDDPAVNPGADEACNDADDNCDDLIDNGCDCAPDGVSAQCDNPTALGVLAEGDVVTSVVGNVPQEGTIDWFAIEFPAAARPGGGTPTIAFSVNENEEFAFDVVAESCGAAGMACTSGGTNGSSIGLTDWTFTDDDPGCCTPPMDSMVAWPAQIFVRVYRTTAGDNCSAYQLTVTR